MAEPLWRMTIPAGCWREGLLWVTVSAPIFTPRREEARDRLEGDRGSCSQLPCCPSMARQPQGRQARPTDHEAAAWASCRARAVLCCAPLHGSTATACRLSLRRVISGTGWEQRTTSTQGWGPGEECRQAGSRKQPRVGGAAQVRSRQRSWKGCGFSRPRRSNEGSS